MGSSKRLSRRNQPASLRWIVIAAVCFLPAAWSSGNAAAIDGDAAAVLVGRVIEVTDGDTLHVALASGPVIVRLHSIDTPERAQPWGRQATAALARRLRKGTEVTLQPITQDEYDRLVAVVYLDDENLNAWMVQQGVEILRKLDELDSKDTDLQAADRIEAAIAARRLLQSEAAGKTAQPGTDRPNRISTPDDELEARIAERRRQRNGKAAGFCHKCGSAVQKSDQFCPKCGSKLKAAE